MSAYALREEVVRVLPRSWVAISFRKFDPHRGFHYIAASQLAEDLPCSRRDCSITGELVCDHIQPHTAGDGDHSRDIRRYLLDGIDLNIDRERPPCCRCLV